MTASIKTRFMVISDTHGRNFKSESMPHESVDIIIHCGDLTQHSKLDEFRETLQMLKQLKASLKLIIAGNHDFSLDTEAFKAKVEEANKIIGEPLETDLVEREFGHEGEAKRLLQDAKEDGIIFLDEGTYTFALPNRDSLKVYASPYTPSTELWGFTYNDNNDHHFHIEPDTDVVITHGPSHGILDMSAERIRIGCSRLFAAVARCQPRMHCFGHVHGGWGAKMVTWRHIISDPPSHFRDIDNNRSWLIESLPKLRGTQFKSEDDKKRREEKIAHCRQQRYYHTSFFRNDGNHAEPKSTIFVNAAIEADGELVQFPWVIDIDLPVMEATQAPKDVKRPVPNLSET
ncbi:uncharacterized protein CTRU02_206422 [Colletotrichum truncatum]|uniref:Uncharacterized protein n=1 Tax=Colletotrichum truncatum TaxID=5467 RepID=A0ACC3Z6T7_COLTU|nr:uncharacterized protein CTRU02_15255 [Colletotrichum truncatum]KAF6781302.1 hypothetical protein CTRU02_15255 [Colletotrichum truncatum]